MVERITYRYIEKLSARYSKNTDSYQTLSRNELAEIRKVVLETLIFAALFGVLGVLLLYLPQYYFPYYFPYYHLFSPLTDTTYEFPLIGLLYGSILVFIELYALVALNIRAVFKIAGICGFPNKNDPDYTTHIESLMRVGLEKDDKSSETYGLNPMQGASKWTLVIYIIVSRLKAAISNYIAKLILRRILGRYAIRTIIDMVGIPVYAFWNAFASYSVIKETKVRIMAPSIIKQLGELLREKYSTSEVFNDYLYDTLQYISMSKRRYHHNHFLLAKNCLSIFSIGAKKSHKLREDYLKGLAALPPKIKEGLITLMVVGFVVDGNISRRESLAINKLQKDGVIDFDSRKVRRWMNEFIEGKGLSELLARIL